MHHLSFITSCKVTIFIQVFEVFLIGCGSTLHKECLCRCHPCNPTPARPTKPKPIRTTPTGSKFLLSSYERFKKFF